MLELNKLIHNLPMPDYLSDTGIGSSTLSNILETPADYKAALSIPFKVSPATQDAMDLGTQIHSAILEPETFTDLYVGEDKKYHHGKKEYKEFAEKHAGKTVIRFDNVSVIAAALEAVSANPAVKDILSKGSREVTAVANFAEDIVLGGIRLKTREDWITNDGFIWDIKTTSSPVTDRDIQNTIIKYKYHFKAAHHLEVLKAVGFEPKGWGWLFITTNLPVCRIVGKIMSEDLLHHATEMHIDAVSTLAECTANDEWPRFQTEITEIDIPDWGKK